MSLKPHLKPLAHKKITTNTQITAKQSFTKQPIKQQLKKPINNAKQSILIKKPSKEQSIKSIKYQRSPQRTSKTIQHYQCDDFDLQIEDNNYFQNLLQKNIKTQTLNKTGKPQAKAQILLPKLQSDIKVRQMKQLQKQLDQQMSKMGQGDFGNHYQ